MSRRQKLPPSYSTTTSTRATGKICIGILQIKLCCKFNNICFRIFNKPTDGNQIHECAHPAAPPLQPPSCAAAARLTYSKLRTQSREKPGARKNRFIASSNIVENVKASTERRCLKIWQGVKRSVLFAYALQ